MIGVLCTQAEYDAWLAAKNARAEDPDDGYHAADAMDCNNLFALSRYLLREYPELAEQIVVKAPEIIERAGEDLGTFMGAVTLGHEIGMKDPKEAQRLMLKLINGEVQ